MRRTLAVLTALALAVAAAACGGDDDPDRSVGPRSAGPPVRVGTKNFTEQYILGELYRQALENAGFRVELKSDIGSSEIIHQALAGGGLDMYPEYVGVLLSEIADRRERPRNPAAAYRLAEAFEERSGFTLLEMTPFSDANALAVKPSFARRHRLRAIGDLRRLKRVRIGAPPEFRTRFEGIVGLTDRYGLRNLRAKPLRIGRQYRALDEGEVDAAAVFTTDGQLAGRRYVLLDDPRGVFAAQHAAPVISRQALRTHGPRLARTIDGVSRRLTTPAMRRMNAAVDLHGRRPRDVAAEFLAGGPAGR